MSHHQKARLKALRKKFHLGEFSKHRKINKRGRIRFPMAKRRTHHKKRSMSHSKKIGVMALILGATGILAYDVFIRPTVINAIPLILLTVAEVALGIWLSSSKTPSFKVAGILLAGFGILSLGKTYVVPMVSNVIPGITS